MLFRSTSTPGFRFWLPNLTQAFNLRTITVPGLGGDKNLAIFEMADGITPFSYTHRLWWYASSLYTKAGSDPVSATDGSVIFP